MTPEATRQRWQHGNKIYFSYIRVVCLPAQVEQVSRMAVLPLHS